MPSEESSVEDNHGPWRPTIVGIIAVLPLVGILHFYGFEAFAAIALISLIFQNLWSVHL